MEEQEQQAGSGLMNGVIDSIGTIGMGDGDNGYEEIIASLGTAKI